LDFKMAFGFLKKLVGALTGKKDKARAGSGRKNRRGGKGKEAGQKGGRERKQGGQAGQQPRASGPPIDLPHRKKAHHKLSHTARRFALG
jgi:hypothetical protein